MYTTYLIISLLFITSLGHSYLFSTRTAKLWIVPLFTNLHNSPEFIPSEVIRKIKNRFLITSFTAFFGLVPIYIFKTIKHFNIENIVIFNILIALTLILSIFTLWFSSDKFKGKEFGHKTIGSSLKNTKKSTINLSEIKVNEKTKSFVETEKNTLSNEIKYYNRPPIKTGPGNNGMLYFALKYYYITKCHKEERIATKYSDQKEFHSIIGKEEGINPNSFKNTFNNILSDESQQLKNITYKRTITLLYKNNEFKAFPNAQKYVKSLIEE